MTAAAIVSQLEALGRDSYKKILLNHSISEPVFGVKIVPKKAAAPGQSGTPGKRRRKKRPESVDLVGRIVLCLLAAYGLVRGLMDLKNLW